MYNKNRRFGERRDSGDGGGSFAPVNVGDEVEVNIEAVGEKGDGIAKIKGFVIFVPGAKQGENVKVRITKVLRKVGFGEIVGAGSGSSSSEEASSEEASSEASSQETSEETSQDEASSEESYEGTEDSESFGEDE